MTVLAIDLGERKTGVAISDELNMFARSLPVIFASKPDITMRKILTVVQQTRPDQIVFGVPYGAEPNMINNQTKVVLEFIEKFEQKLKNKFDSNIYNPQIRKWDESFSSKRSEAGKTHKYRQTQADSEAARLILQEYLDSPDKSVYS